jgi:hypothetical protein
MTRRRSAAALLVVGLLLLGAPAAAPAEQRVADAGVGKIAFAGESIVYSEFGDRVLDAYAVAGSSRLVLVRDGKRRTLLRVSSGVSADDEPSSAAFSWDVSASSLLYRYGYTQYFAAGEETELEVRGGPLTGPYRRLAKCEDGIVDFDWHPVAVSGDRGAYIWNCDSYGAVVRGLAPPTSPPEGTFAGEYNLALAGPYLSVEREAGPQLSEAEVAVVDTRDRRELFTARGLDETEGGVRHALQDDGKLAAHVRDAAGDGCSLVWLSPAEPTPHRAGDALCGTAIEIADDRIAYWRVRKNRKQLVVHDLRGGETVLATAPYIATESRLDAYTSFGSSLAFDGTRTAYAVARCDGRATLLLRTAIAGPVNGDRAPLACPLSVLSTSVRGSRATRTASLPVRCPRGCHGEARVGDSNTYQPLARRPGTGNLTLHLDDPTTERLKRQARATVTVRLRTYDRLGRSQNRTLRLTVRR